MFSESTAYLVVDMLKDAVSSGTGTSAKISGQTVAGKTGTNSDQKGVFFSGMTGYYASSIWIGHDNYKALSSKTTGSSAAAPLWQAYMKKIHANLSNKNILDGKPEEYGLVKVTTCAVSGQLATSACRNDAMDYGAVTDYWANGTQPTVYCQMHTAQRVCLDSGMAASAYCYNTAEKGVITIPYGHPLYQFLGTKYEDVLIEYLGESCVNASRTCTWHTSYQENQTVTNTLIPDALMLLAQAQNHLLTMDVYSQGYSNLQSAITNLQYVISQGSPSQSEVATAMARVTQAMAGY